MAVSLDLFYFVSLLINFLYSTAIKRCFLIRTWLAWNINCYHALRIVIRLPAIFGNMRRVLGWEESLESLLICSSSINATNIHKLSKVFEIFSKTLPVDLLESVLCFFTAYQLETSIQISIDYFSFSWTRKPTEIYAKRILLDEDSIDKQRTMLRIWIFL